MIDASYILQLEGDSFMIELFKKHRDKTPPYLERIDELEKLDIVRLKGRIEHTMIPMIESRIQENRRAGSKIEKNILLDYSKVVDVDSATIAFHLVHLREYEAQGFKVGFIQIIDEMRSLVDIFNEEKAFRVYASEEEAVRELNR